jgi:2-C-methyl-D-erythritol 4-phosphate cytidylyltransferase
MSRYFVIIPAAGIGTRMQANVPKQYLKIADQTILEHSLQPFLRDPRFEKIFVVLHPNDTYWPTLNLQHPKLLTITGGAERCDSVLQGLLALQNHAQENDWILVHDAARPYLQQQDLDNLISTLQDHPVGGLLGMPVRDTLKQVNANHEVIATVDRTMLWQAYTPQMFRFKKLLTALQAAINQGYAVTDEASAIEFIGEKPLMVLGQTSNIKITQSTDLAQL